jgi:hypothetical protein
VTSATGEWAYQRPVLYGLGHPARHRQADQEPVRHRTFAQPESDPKRLTLRRREHFKFIEHGCAQLVQRGEGELHATMPTLAA